MRKELIPAILIILAMMTACYFIVADLKSGPKTEEVAEAEEIETQLTKEDTAMSFSVIRGKDIEFQSVNSGLIHYTGTTEIRSVREAILWHRFRWRIVDWLFCAFKEC